MLTYIPDLINNFDEFSFAMVDWKREKCGNLNWHVIIVLLDTKMHFSRMHFVNLYKYYEKVFKNHVVWSWEFA